MCVVCRRRTPARGWVCEGDRKGIAAMLADLPRKMLALQLQLVPGPTAVGDRVSTSRIGSPTPARLDALSLSGPGAEQVTAMLHPLVRRWSTKREVTVGQVIGPGPVQITVREITEWHQELARDADGHVIQVADDDQIGVLPPAEWLDSWVRVWRRHFGHHVPARTFRLHPAEVDASPRRDELDAVARAAAYNQLLGLGPAQPTGSRPLDPLADEWETRFGEAPRGQAASEDVSYLLLWLDRACDDDVCIGDLAAELRSLSAELARVIGDQPDQQWLGRCPATISDVGDNGQRRPCGAGLWQDPHCSQVVCPRCHAVWNERQLLALALEIRKVWPVDRRRRYWVDEVDRITPPTCPGCVQATRITWREVTATTDDRRWWRPVKVTCPNGCPDTERLI